MELPPLRRFDVTKRELDTKAWNRKVAPDPSHYSVFVDEPAIFYLDGEPFGFYLPITADETAALRTAAQTIEYQEGYRTVGLKSRSRVIGYQPRLTIRRDFCSTAGLARESPEAHAALCKGAAIAAQYFKAAFPAQYAEQDAVVREQTKACWILPDSFYTSGICNWDNQLRYHFDAGNFKGTWNSMFTFKRDLEGGYLAIPEIDVCLAVRDGTLSLFPAATFMHGVTPFKKMSPRAYRYTLVFYALQQMCHCGTPAEELERIRRVKTDREKRRKGTPSVE